MNKYLRRSTTRWYKLPPAILAAGVLLAPFEAAAEIIIDDFADPIHITLPDQINDLVLTDNVGDVDSRRRARVAALQTSPTGFLDIHLDHPSTLTVDIPTTNHTNVEPGMAVNLVYELVTDPHNGVDLAQSGTNNAVILDFGYLTADIPLRRLQVSVLRRRPNGTSTYASTFAPIPQSAEPFNLVFPFDTFHVQRGTAIPDFDFSFIGRLSVLVELALIDPTFPEELNFQMALDRVRVGHAVPEPSTIMNCMVLLTLICIARRYDFVFPLSLSSRKEYDHVQTNAICARIRGNYQRESSRAPRKR